MMKSGMKKRVLSVVLALVLALSLNCLCLTPAAVWAQDEQGEQTGQGDPGQQGEGQQTDPGQQTGTDTQTQTNTSDQTAAPKKTKEQTYKDRMISRAQKKKSKTKWLVLVDKKTHRVGIFKGKKGNWKLKKFWKCGDGKKSTPTPSGTFKIKGKGKYFDSGSARCYYFTNFKPHFYFHSVLCSPRTGRPFGGKQLGVGVSHGCVRLAKGNARWLQKHIPKGTTVYIYK